MGSSGGEMSALWTNIGVDLDIVQEAVLSIFFWVFRGLLMGQNGGQSKIRHGLLDNQ